MTPPRDAAGLRARIRALPWWLRVLAIFAASRIATTAVLLAVAAVQEASDRTGAHPGYLEFVNIWDGQWYRTIAEYGYPAEIPRDAAGHATENAWAFMPAYPMLVRGIMLVTGLPFGVLAPFVSLAFAAGAALVFFRLMRRVLPEGSATVATLLFCTAPLSPILQVSYAESMHLFLLFAALLLLVDRRYLVLAAVVPLMALTRPSGLAFALAVLLHIGHRFAIRRRDPFPPREVAAASVAGIAAAASGVAWPLVAWAVTGEFTAYVDTELAWRRGYVGDAHLLPFVPWFQGAAWWMHHWGLPSPWDGIAGTAAVLALMAGFAAFLVSPWARRLGPDIRFWLAGYALYLLAVFFPQSSTFRLLVPLAPALGALAVPRPAVLRVLLVAAGIAGQLAWTAGLWRADVWDWTPP